MKKLLFIPVFFALAFTNAIQASPLIAQKTVQIDSKSPVEALRIDTSKYKQVRVGVFLDRDFKPSDLELTAGAWALDGDKYIRLTDASGPFDVSFLISTPPNLLGIHIAGKGKFHIYVWGE